LTPNDPFNVNPIIDLRLLVEFISQFNRSRRQLSTYPPGHPMIESALEKTLTLLDQLFKDRESITFGVSKEALMFDQQWLEKKNPAISDFAAALARLGVATIGFHRKPQREELLQTLQLLCLDRQTIIDQGGVELLLPQKQISQIDITSIDYSAFHATEEERLKGEPLPSVLWENLIIRLLSGEETRRDPSLPPDFSFNPMDVANHLNREFQQGRMVQNYDQALAAFSQKVQHSKQAINYPLDRFAELITNLTPDLRRQFLASTFRRLDPANAATEILLGKLPTRVILATLEDINQKQLNISEKLVSLLGKLSRHQEKTGQSQAGGQARATPDQLKEQLTTIFREEEKGKFTPEFYQQTLDQIVTMDELTLLPEVDAERFLQQIQSRSVERHCCAVFLQLFHQDLDPESAGGLQNSLIDLAHFFLEVGDFKGLRFLHCGLLNYLQQNPQSPPAQTDRLRTTLEDPKFQQEVLDSLKRWGEGKQNEIRAYIQAIGVAFAESLIDHLAKEEEIRIRRLYVNTLAAMGRAAHQVIFSRLNDTRWFLVRNLLSVLRIQDDPIDLKKIYVLEKHPHLRVNQELLKLLFKFDRSRADNLLLKKLSSADPRLQAHAIELAEQSRNPVIVDKLLQLLNREKLKNKNLSHKISLIKSLGIIGSETSLPSIEKWLFSGWIFQSPARKQLKMEIVRSLDNYPFARVQPLLCKLASSRQNELRRLAEDRLAQDARN